MPADLSGKLQLELVEQTRGRADMLQHLYDLLLNRRVVAAQDGWAASLEKVDVPVAVDVVQIRPVRPVDALQLIILSSRKTANMTARQSQFLAARTFTPTRSGFLAASACGFFGTLTPLATRQRTVGRKTNCGRWRGR